MSLALLFHYLMLNMFRMLIHPASGACDLFVQLFHGLYCSVRIEVIALAYLFSGELCIFHYSNISLISLVIKASVLLLSILLMGTFDRPKRYHVRVNHW